jgi:uncharacterized protein (DUF302 family)
LGVLLPCNVVLYEKDSGKAVLGVVDPMQTLGNASGDSEMAAMAREVGERLERFLASFSS